MSGINGDESPIAVFFSAMEPASCEALVAGVSEWSDGEVVSPGQERRNRMAFLGAEHWACELLLGAAREANTKLGWELELTVCESPQIAEYGPGEHYGWHSDLHSHGALVRKLSVVVQLADGDAYRGGDFQLRRFASPEEELIPLPADDIRGQGTVLVFPSYQLHRVTPVVSGLRHSLTGWVLGPRYR